MNQLCKKERECVAIESQIARHKRARQLSIFEMNRIKTATRKMKPGVTPSGEAQRWLCKVK